MSRPGIHCVKTQCLVSVVGVASTDSMAIKSPETATKDKQKKPSTPVKKSTTDAKLEAMFQSS